MCMLTVIPAGHVPQGDGIYNGTITNDDGHGWAIVLPRRVMVYHDMNAYRAVERFEKARRKHPEGPALFHSRWATHGRVDESNCHPFKVGGDKKTVLAHNGVLKSEAHPGKGDPRSDTKKYAQDIFPQRFAHSLDSAEGRKRHEEWLGGGNKVAVITANPRYQERLYILNEQAGVWAPDGNWYSNRDYLPWSPSPKYTGPVTTRTTVNGPGVDDWSWSSDGDWRQGVDWPSVVGAINTREQADYDRPMALEGLDGAMQGSNGRWARACPWCFTDDMINHLNGTCERCMSCLDCTEPLSVCMCYTPQSRAGAGQDSDSEGNVF